MKDFTTPDANRLFELLSARSGLSESQPGRLADGFADLHERTGKLFDHQISALTGQLESPDLKRKPFLMKFEKHAGRSTTIRSTADWCRRKGGAN